MLSLQQPIADAVHRARARIYGETILYKRGSAVVEIADAIPHLPEFLVDESRDGAVRVSHQDLDWKFPPDRLVIDGALVVPEKGDRIVRVDLGNEEFEVLPRGSDECWRWSDSGHHTFRVHTKKVA